MRVLNAAIVAAALVASASPVLAMKKPPSEGGGGGEGTSVPEPGSIAMLGSGIAGYGAAVALYRRKKRKQQR